MQLSRLAFLLSAAQAYAVRKPRQTNGCNCAGDTYTNGYIDSSITAAIDGGEGEYPHQYKDYEGFTFTDCSGSTYYEYPLIVGAVHYGGGSPGADRVVYDNNGNFCACLTHTGASGNDFMECSF